MIRIHTFSRFTKCSLSKNLLECRRHVFCVPVTTGTQRVKFHHSDQRAVNAVCLALFNLIVAYDPVRVPDADFSGLTPGSLEFHVFCL